MTKLVLSIVIVIENTIKLRETFTLHYYLYLQLIVRFVVQVNISVVPEALLEVGRIYSTMRRYTRYNKTSWKFPSPTSHPLTMFLVHVDNKNEKEAKRSEAKRSSTTKLHFTELLDSVISPYQLNIWEVIYTIQRWRFATLSVCRKSWLSFGTCEGRILGRHSIHHMDRQTIDRHASSTEFFSWALVVCCMLTFGVPSYNAPIGFWGAYCAHCRHSRVVSRGIFITSFSLLYDLSVLLIFMPRKSIHFLFRASSDGQQQILHFMSHVS